MKRGYKRYLDAKFIRLQGAEFDDLAQEDIQLAMYEALQDHIAWTMDDTKGKPLPQEMAFELSIYFRDIIAGFPNDYTTPIKKNKGGSMGRHPDEQACIEDAVRYLRYAEAGKINDKAPIKTVHSQYGGHWAAGGLARSTVQKWKKDSRFKNIDTDKMAPGMVEDRMKFSGRYYEMTFTKFARAKLKQE